MNAFEHPDFDDHALVVEHTEPDCGLRMMIALHRMRDATPSLGGTRMLNYETTESAMRDVLRLSRGMSYKSAMTGLPYGGAKAVVMGVPPTQLRSQVFEAVGRAVEMLGGRFRTGVDVGVSPDDVSNMAHATTFVVGTGPLPPAELTAQGVMVAIRAGARYRLNRSALAGVRVGIQGLGKVGLRLAQLLIAEGAEVWGSDPDAESRSSAAAAGVRISPLKDLHALDLDIFSPCALGGTLSTTTIADLRARVIAGSANNQLQAPEIGERLQQRDVLYVPDFIANAGGLIAAAAQLESRDAAWADRKLDELAATLDQVFQLANAEEISTSAAAERIARTRLDDLDPAR